MVWRELWRLIIVHSKCMGNSLSVPATVWDDHHRIRYPFIQPRLQKSAPWYHTEQCQPDPTSADLPKLTLLCPFEVVLGSWTPYLYSPSHTRAYQQQYNTKATIVTKWDMLSYNNKKLIITVVLCRTMQQSNISRSTNWKLFCYTALLK